MSFLHFLQFPLSIPHDVLLSQYHSSCSIPILSPARRFGGEKRLEYFIDHLFWDALAIIGYLNFQIVPGLYCAHRNDRFKNFVLLFFLVHRIKGMKPIRLEICKDQNNKLIAEEPINNRLAILFLFQSFRHNLIVAA